MKCIARRLLRGARREAGITLIETVMAIALFGLVSTSLIGVLTSATVADGLARQRSIALELAQQQMEYVRQLSYANAGTVSGNPPGTVLATQQKKVGGLWYRLSTRIKYVDDPIATSNVEFAHYKHVRVIVTRENDGKELARIGTYLSSPTRGAFNKGVIKVTTTDFKTGDPLGGASVALSKTWAAYGRSDETDNVTGSPTYGQVTFAALEATPIDPPGYYEISASLSGMTTLTDDRPPHDAARLQLAPSGTTSTVIRLYKASTVNVRVIDGADPGLGLYSGDVTVTLSSALRARESSKTFGGGITSFTELGVDAEPIVPSADYKVTVRAEVDGGFREGIAEPIEVPEDYSDPSPSKTIEVVLEPDVSPSVAIVTIIVRLNSCTSGDVVSSAAVNINDDPDPHLPPIDWDGSTNGAGQWATPPLPFGTYDISATKRIGGRRYSGALSDQAITADTTVCIAIQR